MGSTVVAAGGALVQVLASNQRNPNLKVEVADLNSWIDAAKLPVTIVRDPDNLPLQTEKALVSYEYCFLVDLKTMEIIQFYIGSSAAPGDSSALRGMRDMMILLGVNRG